MSKKHRRATGRSVTYEFKHRQLSIEDVNLAEAQTSSTESAAEDAELQRALDLSLTTAQQEAAYREQLAVVLQETKLLSSTQICASSSCAAGDSARGSAAEPCLACFEFSKDSTAEFEKAKCSVDIGSTSLAHHTLKVTLDDEIRRLQVTWLEPPSTAGVITAIKNTVRRGFCHNPAFTEARELRLKYQTENGKWCTLVEATIAHFLEQHQGGALKLAACFSDIHENPAQIQCRRWSRHRSEEFNVATPPHSSRQEADDDVDSTWSVIEACSVQREDSTLHMA